MTTSSEFLAEPCGVPRDVSQTMEMTLQQTADFFRTYDCFLCVVMQIRTAIHWAVRWPCIICSI